VDIPRHLDVPAASPRKITLREERLTALNARSAVRGGCGIEFKEIGDSTDQIDLCAAAPVVGTG
jgi:RNase H-fold protein (predicted Holliday junction resolvase)